MFIGVISQRSVTLNCTSTTQSPSSWSANLTQYRQDVGGYVADSIHQWYTVNVPNYDGGSMYVPDPSGYTFDGWYTFSANKGSADSINIDQATVRISTSNTIGYQAIAGSAKTYTDRLGNVYYMVYPKWKVTFRVTFNGNGGTPAEQYEDCGQGGSVTCPGAPTRTGYSFLGWYTAEGTKVGDAGSTYTPTASITLYAQWSPRQITLTLDPNGGSGSPITLSPNAIYGTSNWYALGNVFSRTGYWLTGYWTSPTGGTMVWDASGNCVNGSGYWSNNIWIYAPDGVTSLPFYAQWSNRLCELGYDNVFLLYEWMLNGYSAQILPGTISNGTLGLWPYGQGGIVIYGQSDGYYTYVYTNWDRVSLSQKPFYTFPVNPAYTPYAVSCDVYFYKDGGYEPTDSPSTNAYGTGDGAASRVWLFFYDSAGNYIQNADVFGVCGAYNGHGGFHIEFDAAVPSNAIQATIFFETVLRKGERAEFVSIRAIDKSRSSYAPWQTRFAYWYSDSGNATYNEQKAQDTDPLITPTRTGYTFTGWLDDGGNIVTGNSIVQPYSQPIFSSWELDAPTVFAMLDTGGGVSSPAILDLQVGGTYAALPTPMRPNYSFDGWFTSASGGTQVTSATTVTSTVNHILYAHWTAQSTPEQNGELIYDDASGRLIYDDRPVEEP